MDGLTIYDISVDDIKVDEGFKHLLPKLDDVTLRDLEASLLEHGCLFPFVTWNGILVDGHNRFEIMKRHAMPMRTIKMPFDSREDVIIWIIKTQIQRRNLTPMQLSYFRGHHYNTDKVRTGSFNQYTKSANVQTEHQQGFSNTSERLAEYYNVSPMTIRRDAQLAHAIDAIGGLSPETKEQILAGQGNISRTHLQELASAESEELSHTITQIKEGTHAKRRSSNAKDNPEPSGQMTMDGFITKIANELNLGIRKLSQGDAATSKTAIRSLIDKLEELYVSM